MFTPVSTASIHRIYSIKSFTHVQIHKKIWFFLVQKRIASDHRLLFFQAKGAITIALHQVVTGWQKKQKMAPPIKTRKSACNKRPSQMHALLIRATLIQFIIRKYFFLIQLWLNLMYLIYGANREGMCKITNLKRQGENLGLGLT